MTTMKFPISVVVITRNEEANIARCLKALAWCDDVVVIDDHSEDATVSLARMHGARVLEHRFESFASQRNWALDNASLRHPWALMLDADEVVTPELRSQIEVSLPAAGREVVGYRMCRKTMLFGRWLKHSDDFPVWLVRLIRVGNFQFEDSGHGEVPVPSNAGPFGTLSVPFLHYPFEKGLDDWIQRHNRYSTHEATLELVETNVDVWKGLWTQDRAVRRRTLRHLSRRLPCRAALRFLYQYVIKRGFLDGSAGLTFSWLMAVYEGFIVLKRRELEQAQRNSTYQPESNVAELTSTGQIA
jgi:glycosyltransferase involved in cell wall biosynthesis